MTCRIVVISILCGAVASTVGAADGDSHVAISAPPAQFAPLTSSERLSNYLGGLIDWETVVSSAASAGISQAEGHPKEWGGGAEGFGLRVGDTYAYHFVDRTFRYGLSAALHEDNRYFASGQTGFWKRTKYAIKSTFLARHDDGSQHLSISRFGGAAGGAFVSRIWQPRSRTTAGDGAVSFGITMGSDVGFNVFREFWPDLKRRFHRE